jgi:hypothetical protein
LLLFVRFDGLGVNGTVELGRPDMVPKVGWMLKVSVQDVQHGCCDCYAPPPPPMMVMHGTDA